MLGGEGIAPFRVISSLKRAFSARHESYWPFALFHDFFAAYNERNL